MRTQGGGGVKKRSNFADVLYGWPLSVLSFLSQKWYIFLLFKNQSRTFFIYTWPVTLAKHEFCGKNESSKKRFACRKVSKKLLAGKLTNCQHHGNPVMLSHVQSCCHMYSHGVTCTECPWKAKVSYSKSMEFIKGWGREVRSPKIVETK